MTTDGRGSRGRLRAGDADRDRVAQLLGAAYGEGRLSKDEYDTRLESAYAARTYAELDRAVADLPRQTPAPRATGPVAPPAVKTNGLAVASLGFAVTQLVIGPFGTIPAIVLGHVALRQIGRTGERGAWMAVTGLVLGWAAVVAALIAFLVWTSTGGMHGMPGMP